MWEIIQAVGSPCVRRLSVPGGWLYYVSYDMASGCAVFVPAPTEQVEDDAWERGHRAGYIQRMQEGEKVKPSELASTLAEERAVTARMCAELFNRAADALLDAGHVTWGGIVAELREAARRVVG